MNDDHTVNIISGELPHSGVARHLYNHLKSSRGCHYLKELARISYHNGQTFEVYGAGNHRAIVMTTYSGERVFISWDYNKKLYAVKERNRNLDKYEKLIELRYLVLDYLTSDDFSRTTKLDFGDPWIKAPSIDFRNTRDENRYKESVHERAVSCIEMFSDLIDGKLPKGIAEVAPSGSSFRFIITGGDDSILISRGKTSDYNRVMAIDDVAALTDDILEDGYTILHEDEDFSYILIPCRSGFRPVNDGNMLVGRFNQGVLTDSDEQNIEVDSVDKQQEDTEMISTRTTSKFTDVNGNEYDIVASTTDYNYFEMIAFLSFAIKKFDTVGQWVRIGLIDGHYWVSDWTSVENRYRKHVVGINGTLEKSDADPVRIFGSVLPWSVIISLTKLAEIRAPEPKVEIPPSPMDKAIEMGHRHNEMDWIPQLNQYVYCRGEKELMIIEDFDAFDDKFYLVEADSARRSRGMTRRSNTGSRGFGDDRDYDRRTIVCRGRDLTPYVIKVSR